MAEIKKILVGVDLSQRESFQEAARDAITQETVRAGVLLAKAHAAQMLLFSALNLTEEALHHLAHEERALVSRTVEEAAQKALTDLADKAKNQGVDASWKLVLGKGWLEIIRQVVRDGLDLVVVGTRSQTGLRRLLFGNTAMKLLRRCPCPVWVNKPGHLSRPLQILVATDLKPVSENALRLGITLGKALGAKVHVLHVVEFPLDRFGWTGVPDAITLSYHQNVRAAADKNLRQHLDSTEFASLGVNGEVHLEDSAGLADVAIQHFIQSHQIDLLVMGTIGRSGVPGMIFGNTAERILPEVHCSVLAVKPGEFQSPVSA